MNDLISRQAAIDAFHLQSDDDGWWCGTAEDMETLLKGLPSAQPEQNTGKWIEHKNYPGLAYLCSECNHFTTVRYLFCPNCGAKMEKGQKHLGNNSDSVILDEVTFRTRGEEE